jgi:hypothetical protein
VHRCLVGRLKGRVGLSAGTITLQVPVVPARRPAVLAALLAPLSVGGDALSVGVIGDIDAFGIIDGITGPVLLTVVAALLRFVDETLSRKPDIPGSCQTTLSGRPDRPRWDRPITVSVQHEPVSFVYSGPSDPLGDTV